MKVMPVESIEEALRPVAEEVGVELYEIVFRQGKNPSLTVFLDTDRREGSTSIHARNSTTQPTPCSMRSIPPSASRIRST